MQIFENVTLKVGGATLTIPAEEAARAYLERFMNPSKAGLQLKLPRIGTPLQEGIFAGLARGTDADHGLIVGPEAPEKLNHKDAQEFADKSGGWRLPTPAEQALCFANVPDLFKKELYWSGKPCAGDAGCAWAQHFINGSQGYYDRNHGEFRVRLVRSISILD